MGIDFMDVSEPMEPSKKKIKTTSKKSKPVKNIDFMEVDEKPVKPSQKPVVVDDDDDIIEPKRIIRHARVTETFVDEDGFLGKFIRIIKGWWI